MGARSRQRFRVVIGTEYLIEVDVVTRAEVYAAIREYPGCNDSEEWLAEHGGDSGLPYLSVEPA